MDLLLIIMASISPGLNRKIKNFVSDLPDEVTDSDNPLDKLFVGLLLDMFKIED